MNYRLMSPQHRRTWRRRPTLTQMLWMVICVCGVLYLWIVWRFSASIWHLPTSLSKVVRAKHDDMAQEDTIMLRFHDGQPDAKDVDTDTAILSAMQAAQQVLSLKKHATKNDNLLKSTVNRDAVINAEAHARKVKPLPMGETRKRRFRCIGWRSTENCDPYGQRNPANDQSCTRIIPPNESGYCEIQDRDTGERFRVMLRHCDSTKPDAMFRCFEAWDFATFALESQQVIDAARQPGFALPNTGTAKSGWLRSQSDSSGINLEKGIVMVIYPKLIPSTYATISVLRAQNCTLPIEIWYRSDETKYQQSALTALMDALGPLIFRTIDEQRATGFATKIYAIYHSQFHNVLFLDSDNIPVKDPTYLFDLPEFRDTGALFWPDFWHPGHTIFNIHGRSLLWELVDLQFVKMFEQESGQLLIDRRRSAVSLELVRFYASHQPNHLVKFKLVHGDKDLFRLAWLKAKQPFYMVSHPPGVAGLHANQTFCGMTMVQYDPNGEILFLHRNAKKLLGRTLQGEEVMIPPSEDANDEPADPEIWTHLLVFKPMERLTHYRIDIYEGAPDFPEGQWCYGKRFIPAAHFETLLFEDMPFGSIEISLRKFASEAVRFLDKFTRDNT